MDRRRWLVASLTLSLALPVCAAGAQDPTPPPLLESRPVFNDTGPLSQQEREARFPRAYGRRAQGVGVVLFRDDIERTKVADLDGLFRTVPQIRALIPGRFAMDETATDCGRPIMYIDGERTPPGSWVQPRHRVFLRDFVDLDEIEIVEVHRSAELIKEPFLRVDPAPVEGDNGDVVRRPSRVIKMPTPMRASTCVRIILVWTPRYRPPSA